MYYTTYEDAVKAHCTSETRLSVKIVEHPSSYNRVSRNGSIVHCVGTGQMKSPGHPIGNQSYENQLEFIEISKKERAIPIFVVYKHGPTKYMGNYYRRSIRKCVSFEGFQYYEFEFVKV